jgi:hypothetical protein
MMSVVGGTLLQSLDQTIGNDALPHLHDLFPDK